LALCSDETAMLRICPAEAQDCEQIRELYLSAFPKDEGSVVAAVAIALLAQKVLDLVFVYGDSAYYSRFGCKAKPAAPYLPPYLSALPPHVFVRLAGHAPERFSPCTNTANTRICTRSGSS